jgi:hypothetical protein
MGNCTSLQVKDKAEPNKNVEPVVAFMEGLIHMSAGEYHAHVVDSLGYKFGHIASPISYEGPVYLHSNGHFYAHGVGKITLENGESYKGHLKNGLPDGFGEATYLDGSSYIGKWKNGSKHGKGCLYWLGNHQFEGTWDNDIRHGYGYHTEDSGDAYLENWDHGVQRQINEFD